MDLDENAGLQIELSSESDEESSNNLDKSSNNGEQSHSAGSSSGEEIARGETKAINRSKWVVYLVIALAAAGMGAAAYTFTAKTEAKSFENEVSPIKNVDTDTLLRQQMCVLTTCAFRYLVQSVCYTTVKGCREECTVYLQSNPQSCCHNDIHFALDKFAISVRHNAKL
jgi:hypothetical protein